MKAIGIVSPAHWMVQVEPSRQDAPQDDVQTKSQVEPPEHVRLELSPAVTVHIAPPEHS